MIPEQFLTGYKLLSKEHGSRSNLFHFIKQKYLPHLKSLTPQIQKKISPHWKTQYQATGQNLKKCNFTPNSVDWESMRHIASGFGISICFLFVILLEFELTPSPANTYTEETISRYEVSSLKKILKLLIFPLRGSFLWRRLSFRKEKLYRKYWHLE